LPCLKDWTAKPRSSRSRTASGGTAHVLVEDFEEEAYASSRRVVEVLRELIESNGLKQKDLLDIFGTPSIASEVLREKRGLTVEHIRKLSRRFHVSPKCSFEATQTRSRIRGSGIFMGTDQ